MGDPWVRHPAPSNTAATRRASQQSRCTHVNTLMLAVCTQHATSNTQQTGSSLLYPVSFLVCSAAKPRVEASLVCVSRPARKLPLSQPTGLRFSTTKAKKTRMSQSFLIKSGFLDPCESNPDSLSFTFIKHCSVMWQFGAWSTISLAWHIRWSVSSLYGVCSSSLMNQPRITPANSHKIHEKHCSVVHHQYYMIKLSSHFPAQFSLTRFS